MSGPEYVEVTDGVRLHLRDWGQGKPIVFIHGWPLSNEMWEYQFTQLARNHRCVAVSLRGFGKSEQPWGSYSYDLFADDVKSVIESLNLEEVTLGGFSMGGAIALHYMARHGGAHVRKLALFAAAAPVWIKRPDFPQGGLDRVTVDDLIRQCQTDRPLLVTEFGKIFFRSEDAVSPPMAAWLFDINMQASPHATAACLELLRDSDLRVELAAAKVPTAIFHGWQDKICPFGLAEIMARGIAGAEVIPFEHSGHGLFYEEKDKFNAALAAFAA
ncbi:MAG: hypothetical protein QOK29_3998 [Rhodospirillaceae bacterium]|jgi:non-heme chloroperoxidase|nr:hypothetical protein [Rhodospirillaceae bacterium]